MSNELPKILSLGRLLQHFVLEHQGTMDETELANKLGNQPPMPVERRSAWGSAQRRPIPDLPGSIKIPRK